MKLMLLAVAVLIGIAAPVAAASPTYVYINLLNTDGSNIDTTLLLTINYTNSSGPQSLNSVDDAGDGTGSTIDWGIWEGKSNLYSVSAVLAKDGTDINITINGYEPLTVIANEGGDILGDYNLADTFPPYVIGPYGEGYNYTKIVLQYENQTINVTWGDSETDVNASWLYRNDTGANYTSNYTSPDGNSFGWVLDTETAVGTVNVTVYANDTNGNVNTSFSFTYEVVSYTVITLFLPEPDEYYNSTNVSIIGETTLPANVTYSLNNGPNISIVNDSKNFSAWNDSAVEGLNNLTVYAVNSEDPTDNTSKNVSFYVDSTFPNISYNPETTSSKNHSQDWIFVNVSVTEENGYNITLDFNGTPDTTWNGSDGTNYWWNKTNLSEAEYTIRVSVTDLAGNTNVTPDRAITLDTTAPVIGIDSDLEEIVSPGSVELNYSIVENNLDWVGYSLDGRANVTLYGNTTLINLINGQHSITIYANDSAGNLNSETRVPWINSPIEGRYENDSVTLPANQTMTITTIGSNSTVGEIGVVLDITVLENVNGSINLTKYSGSPATLNSSFLVGGDVALEMSIKIEESDNIKGNLSWAVVMVYYNTSDLDRNGNDDAGDFSTDIDRNTLKLYWNDSANGVWRPLTTGANYTEYNGSYVSNAGVNTTPGLGYLGYVWANVTSLSVYGVGGALIPEGRYENDSVTLPANQTVTITAIGSNSTVGDVGVALDITVLTNVTGSINLTKYSGSPATLNSSFLVGGDVALEMSIKIEESDNIKGNLSWAVVMVYYNTSDLNRNGGGIGAGDINENTLKLYWNDSNGSWHPLTTGENYTGYSGPYVINAGVTSATGSGYLGYVWANVTSLSVYGVGGSLIPAPPAPTGGGSPPPKEILARAILTTSEDWHYAMMAAGFAAANNYILIVTTPYSIDLPTRNNIKWFDELTILGNTLAISKRIEDGFMEFRRTLEPGFAKLNTSRVAGVDFFGTAVQLAELWKDPKGIIVVRGDVFADALVAGQLSAATDSPILFTMPGEIWSSELELIERLKLDVIIVGGEKAVSKEVEDAIKAAGVNVRRVGGKDRYETAALVSAEYVKAAKEKGKDIDTITFLSGNGEWASTLGFRSYVYNSTILYVEEVEGQSAVPTSAKNFIAAHPHISSASIVIQDGAKPKGYDYVDAYIRDMQLDIDPAIPTSIKTDEKDYAFDTNTKSISTMTSRKVIRLLGTLGVLPPGSRVGGAGSGGGGGIGDEMC